MLERRLPHRLCAFALGGFVAMQGWMVNAQAPNSCTLLKSTEIQSLAPAARIGNGVPSTDPLGSLICRYTWETGGNPRAATFNIIIGDASRMFPGMDPAFIKQGVLADAKPRKATDVGAAIPGLGEAAAFISNSPIDAKTTAYLKGHLLIVSLEGPNARAMKDQVIALTKTAASRY